MRDETRNQCDDSSRDIPHEDSFTTYCIRVRDVRHRSQVEVEDRESKRDEDRISPEHTEDSISLSSSVTVEREDQIKEWFIPLERGTRKLHLNTLRAKFPDANGLYYGDMKPVKQCKEFRTNSPIAEIRSEANPHPHPRMAYDVYLEIPCLRNDTLYYVDYRLQEEPKIGVALSGGGTRAAMTALGGLGRLHELGILERASVISSVSGSGFVNAILALNWLKLVNSKKSKAEAFDEFIRQPVRKLCSTNIGMRVLAQDLNPLKNTKRVIRKIFGEDGPVGPITSATIMAGVLAHVIPEMATKMADLPQGPDVPKFVFCSTDLRAGSPFYFTQEIVGPYLRMIFRDDFPEPEIPVCTGNTCETNSAAGKKPFLKFGKKSRKAHNAVMFENGESSTGGNNSTPRPIERDNVGQLPSDYKEHEVTQDKDKFPDKWFLSKEFCKQLARQVSVADAVASSAAAPMVFQPFEIDLAHPDGRHACNMVQLTDGGVYDNLGLDPLLIAARESERKFIIFVNDAGAPATQKGVQHVGWLQRNIRSMDILYHQVVADRLVMLKEKFINHELYGAHWRLTHLNPNSLFADQDLELLTKLGFPPPERFAHKELIMRIKEFRTDINRMSEHEMNVIENAGYALAAFRFQRLCASVLSMVEGTPPEAYHIPYKWPHSLGSDLDVIDSHLKYSNSIMHSLMAQRRHKVRRSKNKPPIIPTPVISTPPVQ